MSKKSIDVVFFCLIVFISSAGPFFAIYSQVREERFVRECNEYGGIVKRIDGISNCVREVK